MLELKIPTKRELLSRLSPQDLLEWKAFYRLEPFGCQVADIRITRLIRLITRNFEYDFPGWLDAKFDEQEEEESKRPRWKKVQEKLNAGMEMMMAFFDGKKED
ncbi:MAG: hypothetical protein EKK48_12235 [Candidatus Melainabacteria bacterium]|nr:MAG: hypothetical protein EKK48_12235 [Candidatus Melainabacteria bacterium]